MSDRGAPQRRRSRRAPRAGDPAGAITVAVRVKPAASRTRVGGRHDGVHGPALVVAVTAPAVDGRATEAARRALADALGVPSAAIALRSGAASRDKLFSITTPARPGRTAGAAAAPGGPADQMTERLRTLRDGPR